MKAVLVTISLMTRVVVEDNATEEQIIEASKAQFIEKIQYDLGDNIEEIVDDEEMPYGSIVQDLRDGDSAILIGLGENNNTKWNGMVGTLENNGKTLRLDTGHTFSVNNENWRITNLIV